MTFDRASYMREYRRQYMPAYRQAHPETFRKCDRRRYHDSRLQAIHRLGGQCALCDEAELEFLTVDHIYDDGAQKRASVHHKRLFKLIVDGATDLTRYRVLCRNCNSGRASVAKRSQETESKHPRTGDPCMNCGRLKLIRRSSHPVYGSRLRAECPYCVRQNGAGLKLQVHVMMGKRCACCGQADPYKLTVDHVFNDGASTSTVDRCGTTGFYRRLLAGKLDVKRFQLLCWNCKFSKHLGDGFCVHQRKEGK